MHYLHIKRASCFLFHDFSFNSHAKPSHKNTQERISEKKKCCAAKSILLTYPDVELGSTSGQERRRLQKTSGGLSTGTVAWWTGDWRWRKLPFRGGARHSRARDCRRIEDWCWSGVVVPGAGTTLGNPVVSEKRGRCIWRSIDSVLMRLDWIYREIQCKKKQFCWIFYIWCDILVINILPIIKTIRL